MKLVKKEVQDGWIVTNKENGNHTHIKYKRTCNNFMCLLRKRKMPTSPYLKESARRLLNDNEYELLTIKYKQKYVNINKGLRG